MELLYNGVIYLFAFILIITILVFIHEFGHYFVARLAGVKVTDFSIGFGKKLFGIKDKSGTEWKICMWPLGGYVKMFGDQDPSSNTRNTNIPKSEEHLAFYSKPLLVKACIVFAGPLANFLLALVILAGFYLAFGKMHSTNEITLVAKDSRAYQAGIIAGDRIIEIDGYNIAEFKDIEKFVTTHPDMPLKFKIKRGNKYFNKIIYPRAVEVKTPDNQVIKFGRLGVATNKSVYLKLGLYDSLTQAAKEISKICYITLKAMGQMIFGERNTDDLGGPIKIAKIAGETVKMGIYPLLWLIAMLSINLGLINLLPIPVLDGGHLLFYVVEAVLGKNIAAKAHKVGMNIGFALIVSLMIFVIINDIRSF